MIFQRGNPMDFQRWAGDQGMERWDYAHCLPYFKRMETVLLEDGIALVHSIVQMNPPQPTNPWLVKYIFPGGFLPSTEAINEITRDHTSLRVVERYCFGADYAETLRQWDQRFLAARDRVLSLGFDETSIRMWHFYLAYSGAGFASGYLDVQQIVMRRESR